ncbi:MAG: class I SAM-dependent methyltransferase [Planctomycetota bacterium]
MHNVEVRHDADAHEIASRTHTAPDLLHLFRAVNEEWERGEDSDVRPNEPGQSPAEDRLSYLRAGGFETEAMVESMRAHYEHMIASIGVPPEDQIGCDLGCWFGFSTACMASLGLPMVYGVDLMTWKAEIAERWRTRHGFDNLRFRPMRPGSIPLRSQSVDWVLMNQVYCNAVVDSFWDSVREARRILKPGGVLIISDANNPWCDAAIERMQTSFHTREIGDGTRDAPRGQNRNARLSIIRNEAPELTEPDAARLANETCYMHEPLIRAAAREMCRTGATPASRFEPSHYRSPIIPVSGAANGNNPDPFEIARDLERLGFGELDITCSPIRQRLGNDELWNQIRDSQGFFVWANKLGESI